MSHDRSSGMPVSATATKARQAEPVDAMAVALDKVSDATGIFAVIPPIEPEPEENQVASRARSIALVVGIGLVIGVGIGFAVYFGFNGLMEMWAQTWPENQPK